MKKLVLVSFAVLMLFSIVGCKDSPEEAKPTMTKAEATEEFIKTFEVYGAYSGFAPDYILEKGEFDVPFNEVYDWKEESFSMIKYAVAYLLYINGEITEDVLGSWSSSEIKALNGKTSVSGIRRVRNEGTTTQYWFEKTKFSICGSVVIGFQDGVSKELVVDIVCIGNGSPLVVNSDGEETNIIQSQVEKAVVNGKECKPIDCTLKSILKNQSLEVSFVGASCDDVGCDLETLNSPDLLKELFGPLLMGS